VYKDYPPVLGGIELHVRDLAEGLARRGHDVTVLVTRPAGETTTVRESGVTVIRCRRLATVASTPVSLVLARQLGRIRPDVTHLHIPYPIAEAAWLLRGTNPMVATYHSDVVRQKVLARAWAPLLRRVLARADLILATSPNYVRTSPFLAGRSNIAIVPNGIDPRPFQRVSRATATARFGSGPNVVFVGRLVYYKGLDVLLEAMTTLENARLLIAGTGPMETDLRRRAAALAVSDRVVWLGAVPAEELPLVYAAGDVFVLPAVARSEAFGIVQLEAMASGLPIVTTELGTGTSWVTIDGETGVVVPPANAAALSRAISALLADPTRAQALGAAGRKRASEVFSLEQLLDNVEAAYLQVQQ
jgi:rhamnosyl/mannosyltransferase